MKSVFAFSGTYVLLIFGPMFLARPSSGGSVSDERAERALGIMGYLLEHSEISFLICLLVVLAYNITVLIKNGSRKHLVSLSLDENLMEIGLTNSYYKTIQMINVPIENLEYEVKVKSSSIVGKTNYLNFFDNRTEAKIAFIKPGHALWSKQVGAIKKTLAELEKRGVKRTSFNRPSMFRRFISG